MSCCHVKMQFDSIPAGLVVVPHTDIDNVVAPMVGIEIPLVFGSHVSVVPALRVHAFTLRTSGMNGFTIRPGVAIRWTS